MDVKTSVGTDPGELLRGALVKIKELKAALKDARASASEPIAIVGMGCRFPGGGDDPDAYFEALLDGTDGVRRIPPERWLAGTQPVDRPELRWAGLLDAVDGFDPACFGISPREAVFMDPQQRLLLEVVSETLQRAGVPEERLMGSRTGVFVGMCNADYEHLVRRSRVPDAYRATGSMASTAAGRIAYVLGLVGPCLTVDTACSSSLVAVHLAVKSLRNRECELALAGGVNVILDPTTMAMLAETQAISPDGRCRTFDARANGFVRGEGCGIVALRRLSDATRDGDPILAVIRGTAVNQDGRSMGMTAPSVLAQQAMLQQALDDAGASAADVGYVETHGTGTSLGDPIEVDALRAVLGAPRADGSRCVLGAVKSNIGHLEAAAGVAGLIKAVACLGRGVIPKNLHFQALNPRISIDGTPFVIPTEATPWPRGSKRRLAGVSSFGLSGTNAHVLLEEGPPPPEPSGQAEASSHLLVLSARSPSALTALAGAFRERLAASGPDERLDDVTRTAMLHRSHHEHRLAVVGASKPALVQALEAHLRGEPAPGLVHGTVQATPPPVVLVFAGQGSQWVGMGTALLDELPAFREALLACDAALAPHLGWSVVEELRRPESESRLAETLVAQPALFSLEVALAAALRTLGVTPSAVIGHSVGEIAAAHVAGILDLDQAARLVAIRARIMQKATGHGRMVSVELSEALAEQAIVGLEDRVGIAAINGPRQIVLSGDTEPVEALQARLAAQGVEARPLRVDYAFHSPQMDALRTELVDALGTLAPRAGTIAFYSTVTGDRLAGTRLDAAYWGDNVRRPVRLAPAIARAAQGSRCVFLEVGPHPVLSLGIEQTLAEHGAKHRVLHTLRRQRPDREQLLLALAGLHVEGSAVDWARLHAGRGRMISLPLHPWQRRRFWLELAEHGSADAPRRAGARASGHPLLGAALAGSPAHADEHAWESLLGSEAAPYLGDHRVGDAAVFPAAGYAELALAAGAARLGAGELVLEELSFEQMLVLEDGADRPVQVVLTEAGPDRCRVQIASLDEAARRWTTHARGTVARPTPAETSAYASTRPESLAARLGATVTADQHRARMRARSLHYGPAFQGLVELRVGDDVALGRVVLPEGTSPDQHLIHPALLDACLQASTAFWSSASPSDAYLPVAIDRLHVRRPPAGQVWAVATRGPSGADADELSCDLRLVDDEGEVLVALEGLRVRRIPTAASAEQAADALERCALELAWRRLEPLREPSLPAGGAWLLLMDREGVGAALAGKLAALGQSCVRVVSTGAYETIEPGLLAIDPASPEDYVRVVREAIDGGRWLGVVHLVGLDSTSPAAITREALEEQLRAGTLGAAYLAQALVHHGATEAPRLFVVTRGAQAVGASDPISVAQAPLLGLGKTIALEHPELRCTRIDLAAAPDPTEVDALLRELCSSDGEDQVALRPDGRHGARLTRGTLPAPRSSSPIRADGSYLVTGGLGGLGLALARWLVEQGARHLVLVGRRDPDAEASAALRAMEAAGARVRVESVDVSSPGSVASLLARLDGTMPPLRGVFHAAGALDDRTLVGQSEQSFRTAFAGKAIGAWNLHAATQGHELDVFVTYSSVASLLGSAGQANYAAANAFLDALAHERRRTGLPALSVQWGAFSEVGMAASDDRAARLSAIGLASMTPADGLRALQRLLGAPGPAVVGVAAFDAATWISRQPDGGGAAFLSELAAEPAVAGEAAEDEAAWRAIALLPKDEAGRVILARLARVLGSVLRIDASELADTDRLADTRFSALGVDSLMATELRNQIRRWADVDIPATMMIGGSRVSELVELVHQKALVRSLALAPEAASQADQDDAEVFIL